MKNKKKLLCTSIALAIAPIAISFADQNKNHIEVDETSYGKNVYSNDWMSIEIGTITEVKKDDQNGLNFDHNSPIARGRNSIAIGTSSVAGGSINNDEDLRLEKQLLLEPKHKQ